MSKKYMDGDEDAEKIIEEEDEDNENEGEEDDSDVDADDENGNEYNNVEDDYNNKEDDEDEKDEKDEKDEDENEDEKDEDEDEDERFIEKNIKNEEDEDDEDINKHKKINQYIDKKALIKYHPECEISNFEEIRVMSSIILKEAHVTIPLLTKYERARVIGMRTVQLNNGAHPLINVPDSLIDNSIIAEQELVAKKIPYIICRPFSNGQKEYWKLEDLEII